jgi:hypothetical protein
VGKSQYLKSIKNTFERRRCLKDFKRKFIIMNLPIKWFVTLPHPLYVPHRKGKKTIIDWEGKK